MEKFEFFKWNEKKDLVQLSSFQPDKAKIINIKYVKENSHEDKAIIPDKSAVPEWVKNLGEIGLQGEMIAFSYLSTVYNSVNWETNDRLGYDILADNVKFEIKTTEKSGNSFHISKNELLKADEYEPYRLFFIKIKDHTVDGYMFSNLYEVLGVSYNEIVKKSAVSTKDDCSITATNYQIVLSSEVLELAEYVNLDKHRF